MRETKFKGWDRINKRWVKLWKLCFAVTGELMAIEDIEGEIYGKHQVALVEYTGREDKNGKEIYEGDIVKFLYNRKEYILPISWGTDGWWVKGLGWFKELYWAKDRCEVIGNIYENPELLTKELE